MNIIGGTTDISIWLFAVAILVPAAVTLTFIIGMFFVNPFKLGMVTMMEIIGFKALANSFIAVSGMIDLNLNIFGIITTSGKNIKLQVGSIGDDWTLTAIVAGGVFLVSAIGWLAKHYIDNTDTA